ncbi:MAG: (E)-4-hydroxy-3-methylbut-2-enyl-diphosphate synthase [Myxococcota bacterium]|nr:(E)-4-hydroxy-3-methylbut-2-enyl-diphosphate synthase [Myxococcota bacterium]
MTLEFPGNPFAPRRRRTREVRVGDVGVGGENPIRVQSMTTTDTQDVAGTVAQAERLVAVGCEIVRITAPSLRDAEALGEIHAELTRRGIRAPLVADIHFTPNAALEAARWVEKIRINPGNFADKKKFEVRAYDDVQWQDEQARVAERFRPLVRRCKELGRAMRIGTNHGSLSDRILNRYGDTAEGMVESALEFLAVCEDEGYFDVIFSMKASNPQVAIRAYRMLAVRLAQRSGEGRGRGDYPFHVGVTEAGDGEDGRIKSAIGIGSLLEDGLGDTIRVSLTEDPVKEIPVAQALARRIEARWQAPEGESVREAGLRFVDDPFGHARRASDPVALFAGAGPGRGVASVPPIEFGGTAPVRAELDLGAPPDESEAEAAAWQLADALAARREIACEGLRFEVPDEAALERVRRFGEALERHALALPLALRMPASLAAHASALGSRWVIPVAAGSDTALPLAAARTAAAQGMAVEWALVATAPAGSAALLEALDHALAASGAAQLGRVLISVESPRPVPAVRLVTAALRARGAAVPLVLVHRDDPEASDDDALLHASIDLGALLCDGIGDAIVLPLRGGVCRAGDTLALAYRILQGARLRTTWTEFISCPSCGRTLFDLEETTARIKAKTQHLKGLKIAVMGCIVNGPGEMADADFGYVGSGPGLVNLYVGHDCVERHVPAEEATARLVDLIKRHERWVEPS